MSNTQLKIEKVIESCSECRFGTTFKALNSAHSYLFVCTFLQPTVLIESTRPTDASTVPIPNSCPLDNYTGDNKDVYKLHK